MLSTPYLYQYIGFEDILVAIKEDHKHIILNTLSHDEQNVLIKNTILSTEEENIINSLIDKNEHIKFFYDKGKFSNNWNKVNSNVDMIE